MRWLQQLCVTWIRRASDWLSKVVKFTVK